MWCEKSFLSHSCFSLHHFQIWKFFFFFSSSRKFSHMKIVEKVEIIFMYIVAIQWVYKCTKYVCFSCLNNMIKVFLSFETLFIFLYTYFPLFLKCHLIVLYFFEKNVAQKGSFWLNSSFIGLISLETRCSVWDRKNGISKALLWLSFMRGFLEDWMVECILSISI